MTIPPELQRIAESLGEGESSPNVTVRQLLAWFGQQRRGWRVVATVQGALRRTGLATEPDFATAYIDGHLNFSRSGEKAAVPQSGSDDDPADSEEPDGHIGDPQVSEALIEDPVLRVRMLPAANRQPVKVNRDDAVETALLLMAMHDYSQLPSHRTYAAWMA